MASTSAVGSTSVQGLVDHLFRRESGRIVASLTRSFGPAHLELAEEVMQDALLQALRRWPYHGIPERPGAWLHRVARNLALDRLRRDVNFRGKEKEIQHEMSPLPVTTTEEPHLSGEITDDQLRLIFLCCHPDLPRNARVALTLKTVAGFSVVEIASAFLARKATIAQRLVRAKERIRERKIPFEVPSPQELPSRLETVLEVLYLMFNEGYASRDGEVLVRSDLCRETLRLVVELAALPTTDRPAVHALASLFFFQASRLPARLDSSGNLVLLADQDRTLWDRSLIRRAFEHLDRSAAGNELTTYHLQAAIAARHAAAGSDAGTDWAAILELYEQLYAMNPSPIVALNRAVALARVAGPQAGLDALAAIDDRDAIEGYYLLPATRGQLLLDCGVASAAAEAYREALRCTCSEPERRFLSRRLADSEAMARATPQNR